MQFFRGACRVKYCIRVRVGVGVRVRLRLRLRLRVRVRLRLRVGLKWKSESTGRKFLLNSFPGRFKEILRVRVRVIGL